MQCHYNYLDLLDLTERVNSKLPQPVRLAVAGNDNGTTSVNLYKNGSFRYTLCTGTPTECALPVALFALSELVDDF